MARSVRGERGRFSTQRKKVEEWFDIPELETTQSKKKALISGRKMQKKCKFRPLILAAESLKIRTRIGDFVAETGAKESIFPTLITTYGLRAGEYSSMVQAVVTMDDLFAE